MIHCPDMQYSQAHFTRLSNATFMEDIASRSLWEIEEDQVLDEVVNAPRLLDSTADYVIKD